MPDKDEFEPLGRRWGPLFRMYIDPEERYSAEDIAHKALNIVSDMLCICGGCPILDEVVQHLNTFDVECQQRHSLADRYALLDTIHPQLDALERIHADHRVSMVAIRTARTLAHELATSRYSPSDSSALQQTLATRVLHNVIAHCSLDRARAFSVGKRCQNGTEAHTFYRTVFQTIADHSVDLTSQFLHDPTGRNLGYAIPKTRSMSG